MRPEYYKTVDELISVEHMSQEQAISAVIRVGNNMFGMKWKKFDEEDEITIDTVPDKKMNRKMSKVFEAFTISKIVELMISEEEKTTVTYHDDGSRSQGAGAYSVQGLTIKGKFYPLPTLALSSETRQNLADLKVIVMSLLSVCGGVSTQLLWSKVDFVMADSVSHNLYTESMVSEQIGVEHIPGHLQCQVHPSLMFSREMVKVWKEVDAAIGPDKIFAHFAINQSDSQDSVTEQWLNTTLRLVTHDSDHKAWNKAGEFDQFIFPEKNPAKRLIKERFNSLVYSCALTNFLDSSVISFLDKFTNITNSLACVVRSFEEIEYLRILSTVGVIIGTHLIEPFLSLTTSSQTTWEKLMTAFPTLYKDLTSVKSELMLDLTKPALSFISQERFESCRYTSELLKPTEILIEAHRADIVSALNILLPRLAEGWARQRGNQFGFGENAEDPSHLKVSGFDQEKLKEAPINNIPAERMVGSINHELKIRGAKNLKTASSSLVRGKGLELTKGQQIDVRKFKKLTENGGEIPNIIASWEKKQEDLKREGLDGKEMVNIAVDQRRNSDLALLSKEGGPFTSPDDVKEYMEESQIKEEVRNKRLYLEVSKRNSDLQYLLRCLIR